ncbi:MAG: alginate export family protein [Gammaproteobacteria bacterium]|nr:alginate export family protein [Gammaproteobacteria bacterium]
MNSFSIIRISLLGLLASAQLAKVVAAEAPSRINDVLGLDDGFSLGLIQRTRFENIADNVQAGASDNDQVLALRTILNGTYNSDNFTAQIEFADIRQELADRDSILKSRTVNTRDFLQANIGYRLGTNRNTWIRIGRFSEDWGSRRLMARNRYRNTINAFDGVVIHHNGPNGMHTRVMATEIVRRLPGDFTSLLDNKYQADESSDAQRFYGFHTTLPNLFDAFSTELFYYSLKEKDTSDVSTRNRDSIRLVFG